MAKPAKPVPEIVRVAEALEAEVARLESIAWAAKKARLDSEKNIVKAAAELKEAIAMPGRLAERLQALSVAMARMQERQQAALEPLAVFASSIQQRTAKLGQHMEAFAALGRSAGEISTALAIASDPSDEAARAAADARLQELSAGARALFEAARDDDFPEIAREADVLKQRLSSLRKRLAG
jgi:chromosome segregation ATPase